MNVGKREGEGVMLYNEDGTIKYEGNWVGGVRQGFGIMTYSSKNVYKGKIIQFLICISVYFIL